MHLCPSTLKNVLQPMRMVGWLHALMQSHCLYSLFFEHYNCNISCNRVLGRYSFGWGCVHAAILLLYL